MTVVSKKATLLLRGIRSLPQIHVSDLTNRSEEDYQAVLEARRHLSEPKGLPNDSLKSCSTASPEDRIFRLILP